MLEKMEQFQIKRKGLATVYGGALIVNTNEPEDNFTGGGDGNGSTGKE